MILGDVLLSGAYVRPRSSLTNLDNDHVAIPVSESPLMYLFGCTPNSQPKLICKSTNANGAFGWQLASKCDMT